MASHQNSIRITNMPYIKHKPRYKFVHEFIFSAPLRDFTGMANGIRKRRSARKAGSVNRVSKKGFRAVANYSARAVVQWFAECGARPPEIERRTMLSQDFVQRWAKRGSVATAQGKGPTLLISAAAGVQLKKAIVKSRFATPGKVGSKILRALPRVLE